MAENDNNNQQPVEDCGGNCSSCSANCASRKQDLHEPCNQYSNVKKVIAVVSGKGGVGKSLVTSCLTVMMNRKGYKTAVLDADITGPSIPKSFGIKERAQGNEMGILPAVSRNNTEIMSVNLLLDSEEMPVLWRGPIIAGTVKQFWTEVVWGDVDYMFVDMPPGTGDVPLTVFQSLPIDGIIVVTSPQELVSMIVGKAVNMAKAMNVPIIGIVENYSYIECPDCGKHIPVFGKSHIDETCEKYGLKCLAKLPVNSRVAEAVDEGMVEDVLIEELVGAADFIESTFPVEK
jgi:Mrp family chromosome partitioning ATPase